MKGSRRFALWCFALLLCSGCAASRDPVTAGDASPSVQTQQAAADQIEELSIGEFLLGPGDKIEVTVFRHDDLQRSITVDLSGKVMFPLIGDLQAGGKSVFALRDEMALRLSRYLVNPMVSVEVAEVRSRRMMVLGKVQSPGYFVLETEVTALEALAKAGGGTDEANLGSVLLVRRTGEKRTETLLDLRRALNGKDLAANVKLQSGDILYVPSTRISNISRVATYLSTVISPIVALEGGIVLWPLVKDVLQGKSQDTPVTIPTSQ